MEYPRFKLPATPKGPATVATVATVPRTKPENVANVATVAGGKSLPAGRNPQNVASVASVAGGESLPAGPATAKPAAATLPPGASLQQPSKPSKGAFGSFVSDQSEHVFPERSGGEKASEQPKVAAQSPAATRFSDLYETDADYARALIRYAKQDGLGLHISSGRLIITAGQRNDTDLLGELRAHESAVLECLQAELWGNWR